MSYTIAELPETHVDIFDYRKYNPRILTEDVAWAWMFINAVNDKISVRSATPQNGRLELLESIDADGTKTKYTLTETDKANTVALLKDMMRLTLDEVYDKRLVALKLTASNLEQSTWDQQRAEAEAWTADNTASTPLLTSLAAVRGIQIDDMVQLVLTAVANYDAGVVDLMTRKQTVETEITNASTIAQCRRIMHERYETWMTMEQMTQMGLNMDTDKPTFNLN